MNQHQVLPYDEPKTKAQFDAAINKPGCPDVVEFYAPSSIYCINHAGVLASLADGHRRNGFFSVRVDGNPLKTFVHGCGHDYKIISFSTYIMFREKDVFKRLETRPTVPQDGADFQRRVGRWMYGN